MRFTWFLLILALGAWLRLEALSPGTFPLNDGGYWYSYYQSAAKYNDLFPDRIYFNGTERASLYPPLGGAFLASLQSISGVSPFALIRWLPFIYSLLMIVGVALIGSKLFPKSNWSLVPALLFAILPVGYRWFLMGGGISRGLGGIWLLLGIYLILGEKRSIPVCIISGICFGLAILTHPVAGMLAVLSSIIITVKHTSYGRVFRAVCLPMATVSMLWLGPLIFFHGASVLTNAFNSTTGLSFASTLISADTFGSLSILSGFGVVGFVVGLFVYRSWYSWLHASLGLIAPLFIHCGFGSITIPFLVTDGLRITARALSDTCPKKHRILLISLFSIIFFSAFVESHRAAKQISLQSLSQEEFNELVSLKNEIPAGAPVVVISNDFIAGDAVGEWTATITGAHSLLTHQLEEWTGKRETLENLQSEIRSSSKDCEGPNSPLSQLLSLHRDALVLIHRRSNMCAAIAAHCPGKNFALCSPAQK